MAKPVRTIGNPLSWVLHSLRDTSHYAAGAAHEIGGDVQAHPMINQISIEDVRIALRKGAEDFAALRTDVLFIAILYPVIGLVLMVFAFQQELVPLLFPLLSGFALLGPIAAVGLYEMSRRREKGEPAGWRALPDVIGSPAIGSVLVIGAGLVLIFAAWMSAAFLIFNLTLGPEPPASVYSFLRAVFTTGPGWTMLIAGCVVGFAFAAATLAITVISIPLVLHRHVGVPVAIATSFAVTKENPVTVAVWGLVVATFLFVGAIPLLLGLIFAFPILGHATWHLYRRAVT